jgi:hypothetical protein
MTRSGAPSSRIGRALELLLTLLASLVFVLLWIYVAAAVLTDGMLLADTWAWLSGLELIPAIIAWIAILPIGVFVWTWQADLEPVFFGLVMLGLVGWTAIAWSGLLRIGVRRRRGPGD